MYYWLRRVFAPPSTDLAFPPSPSGGSPGPLFSRSSLRRTLFDNHGANVGLADKSAIDQSAAGKPPHVAAAIGSGHVEFDPVARQDGLAELRLVDAHEIDERNRSVAGM